MNSGRSFYGMLLAGLLLVFYGAWAGLWLTGQGGAYRDGLSLWGVRAVEIPGETAARPFFDLQGVMSWRDCRLKGVDVATENPCDVFGRRANYPPLWLHLPLEHMGGTLVAGGLLAAGFLLSLVFVFRPQSRGEFLVAAAACLSHVTLYAVERGNVDMLLFLLMLGAVAFWRRGCNAGFFILALLGGFLKLYPLAMMAMLLRGRLRTLLIFAFLAATGLAGYVAVTWHDFARLGGMLPKVLYFYDMFGAMLLPLGIADALGLPGFRILLALAMIAGLWLSISLARSCAGFMGAIDWNDRCMSLLLASAFVIVFCFMLGANVDYRAIFLLTALPGLLALRSQAPGALRPLFGAGVAALLFCLYSEAVRVDLVTAETALLGHAPQTPLQKIPLGLCFLLRESIWWFLIVLLAALLLCFVRGSASFRDLERA